MTIGTRQVKVSAPGSPFGVSQLARIAELLYGPGLALLSVGLVLWAIQAGFLPSGDLRLLYSLAVAAILVIGSEFLVVSLPFRWATAQISVSSISALGVAIWLGPVYAGILHASVMFVLSLRRWRHVGLAIENSSSVALSTVVTGILWWSLVPDGANPLTSIRTSLIFLAVALVHSAVNFGTVSVGTALARRAPILQLVVTMAGGWNFVFTIPVLAAFIPLVGSQSPIALVLFSFPLVSSHLALKALWRLESDTQLTLAALTDILEMRDPYTAFHSDRVAIYSQSILNCLPSISAREAATIQRAARIHDIGKVAVRDAVLLKNGPLDQEERRAIESHPSIGADLVARMHAYRDCIEVIRHHHERWDGGGYPSRLIGDCIPIGARVIAVADSFDAMTTDRPYRKALSFETAVGEVRKNAGIQFDPDVANAFLQAIEDPSFQRPPNPMSGQVAAD